MVSQKIQATASKKGFTLVELIVVITILAILGTIGFISIQGYSAQSRDSKRTSDLRSLASALTIKATDGIALTSFVTTNNTQYLTGAVGSGTHLGGAIMNTTSGEYSAGIPNYTALGVSAANFKDGSTDYKIGTSTRNGGVFQIAASLEGGGTKSALTSGNYSPRNGGTFTGTVALGTGSGFTVTNLSGTAIGYFNKGDVINVDSRTATITSTNGDGAGFAANVSTLLPTAGVSKVVGLATAAGLAEAPGLVAATITSTGVTIPANTVAVGGTNLPY